jgi:hypothetical protein
MSFLFQRALKSSAEYSVALLKQIREGEEDYEQLQSNYNAALGKNQKSFQP